jgi:hypothetical protein
MLLRSANHRQMIQVDFSTISTLDIVVDRLCTAGSAQSTISDVSASVRIDRLELDLRLKEADNRFLQEELEKKDKMLAMLTEGLREVAKLYPISLCSSP